MKTLGRSALALCIAAGPVFAGEISEVGDFDSECTYKFTGQVEPGDAAKVKALNTFGAGGASLCLDSPGGSLSEGIAMFDVIWNKQMHTRVIAGDRCESACALAWLGGGVSEGTLAINFPSRSIQPGAVLGFHAPSLNLPPDNNYPAGQVEDAFGIALKAAEGLFDIKLTTQDDADALNDYLYARTLETPGYDMYHIDTVGDALLANVQVSAARAPETLTRANILALCENAFLMEQGVLIDPWDAEEEMTDAASHLRYLRGRTVEGERVGYINEEVWAVRMYYFRRSGHTCLISDKTFGSYISEAKKYNQRNDLYPNGRVYQPEIWVRIETFDFLMMEDAEETWEALEQKLASEHSEGTTRSIKVPFYALYDAETPLRDLQAK